MESDGNKSYEEGWNNAVFCCREGLLLGKGTRDAYSILRLDLAGIAPFCTLESARQLVAQWPQQKGVSIQMERRTVTAGTPLSHFI